MKHKKMYVGRTLIFFAIVSTITLFVAGIVIASQAWRGGEQWTFLPLIRQEGTASETATITPTTTLVSTVTTTPSATADPNSTITPISTPTATVPYIDLIPNCSNAPSATFSIVGGNWPTDETLFLYWYDPHIGTDTFVQAISATPSGSFTVNWTMSVISNTTYIVKVASSISYPYPDSTIQKPFTVPCPSPPTPTITATPAPVDLVIVGPPVLISTPPIVAYHPVQFNLTISNTSDFDADQLFFVDIFIDPGIPVPSGTISIPLSLSDGFTAVSSLAAQTSRIVTITSQLGFTNTPETHLVYGMVDSVAQISETGENNNLSTPLVVTNVTPASTATSSPTPSDGGTISGIVRVRITNWVPAYRALVSVFDDSFNPVAQMFTDSNGYYQFSSLPPSTSYTVTACYELDGDLFFGSRTGIVAPAPLVNIFMLQGNCQ